MTFIPPLIMFLMGFAFGASTWPLGFTFKHQLVYTYVGFLALSAVVGWLHHEPASFVLFTASVFAVPFAWAAENFNGWVSDHDKASYHRTWQFFRRNTGRWLQAHRRWAVEKAVSVPAYQTAQFEAPQG